MSRQKSQKPISSSGSQPQVRRKVSDRLSSGGSQPQGRRENPRPLSSGSSQPQVRVRPVEERKGVAQPEKTPQAASRREASSETGCTALAFQDCTSRAKWDNFITSHKESNFLQSWDFYEFHKSRGLEIVRRIAIDSKGKVHAAYAGVVEHARRGRHLAIAAGPILDWTDKKLVDQTFADIKKQGIKNHCVFVRIRPQLELSENSLKIMKTHGLKKAPMYLSVEYAGILDLHNSEEEILKNASQGLRRKVRKALKNDIKITKSTDPKIIKTFYQIQLDTARRQKFVAFSEDFFQKQFTAFAKHNEVAMYTATKDDQILAQNFIIFYGDEASYHYGVSSTLGTKYSAAPLLHLEAMRDARTRKIHRYNFWGIVGLDEKQHRFYGVSEFKRSFGVTELKYTPAHDLVLDSIKYLKTFAIEKLRTKVRHV